MHRKHLKDNGIKILSAMENIPDSPEGILLESLLEGMNQYYSAEYFYGHNPKKIYNKILNKKQPLCYTVEITEFYQ